jgi:hypothetical protein
MTAQAVGKRGAGPETVDAYKLACAAPAAGNADADWGETLPVGELLTRSCESQPSEIESRRAA